MRRKSNLNQVRTELVRIRKVLDALAAEEMPSRLIKLSAFAHIPHVDACISYIDHVQRKPRLRVVGRKEATP